MNNQRITLQELANKIDWEGGVGEGLLYFGRDLNSTSQELNSVWERAYDAIEEINNMLPESTTGVDDE